MLANRWMDGYSCGCMFRVTVQIILGYYIRYHQYLYESVCCGGVGPGGDDGQPGAKPDEVCVWMGEGDEGMVE